MSAYDYATDVLTRHQIFLQRYSNGEVEKLLPFVEEMRKNVALRIRRIKSDSISVARLHTLQRDLNNIVNLSMDKLGKGLDNSLADLGIYEAGFTERMLQTMVNVDVSGTSIRQIKAAINNTPMSLITGNKVSKLTVRSAVKQFSKTTSKSLLHSLQMGIAEGANTTDIATELNRIVKHRTHAQAEALVRTAANHAGTMARNEVYKENEDIIDKEEYVATLDNKTTLTCSGLDGKRFEVGEGAMPSMHFNCRSLRVPIVYPEFTLAELSGERAASGDYGAGTVGSKSTYSGWLRKQSAKFQDSALGKKRAALFRRGKLPIDKFTNNKGIVYDLKKLESLEPEAFELAGFNRVPVISKVKKKKGVKKVTNTSILVKESSEVSRKFISANTVKDVETRLHGLGIGEVSLKGMKIEQANAVLRAFEDENFISPLKLKRLKAMKRSNANWGAMYSPSNKSITLNTAHIGKGHSQDLKSYNEQIRELRENIEEYKEKYLNNPQYVQGKVKGIINRTSQSIRELERRIDSGEKARYWSLSTKVKNETDAIRATVTHEIGHHRHDLLGNDYTGYSKLTASSEYGRTNTHEYFAEWYTTARIEGLDNVPERMLDLINQIGN